MGPGRCALCGARPGGCVTAVGRAEGRSRRPWSTWWLQLLSLSEAFRRPLSGPRKSSFPWGHPVGLTNPSTITLGSSGGASDTHEPPLWAGEGGAGAGERRRMRRATKLSL